MSVLYFDCFSGASGDMILGALIDAGAPLDAIRAQLTGIPATGFELHAERITKQGFAATQVRVETTEQHAHRHLKDIVDILERTPLSDVTRKRAVAIFTRLAEAEAGVHGCSVQRVHFHEVGALDAIVDITGACLALELLGIEELHCSAIPTGSGTVDCGHGTMPVPAPATAALLCGVPLAPTSETGELTTPTGAAILTTLVKSFGPLPGMTLGAVGYGAGRRDGQHRPNILRVLIGEAGPPESTDEVFVLEASIDDQSAELTAHAAERLLAEGALDVYSQPILMKKGRPGTLLTVLAPVQRAGEIETAMFTQTSTFGIRRRKVQRRVLARRFETVEIPEGSVRIKIGALDGREVSAKAEFEDCRRLAEDSGAPAADIMARATAAWYKTRGL